MLLRRCSWALVGSTVTPKNRGCCTAFPMWSSLSAPLPPFFRKVHQGARFGNCRVLPVRYLRWRLEMKVKEGREEGCTGGGRATGSVRPEAAKSGAELSLITCSAWHGTWCSQGQGGPRAAVLVLSEQVTDKPLCPSLSRVLCWDVTSGLRPSTSGQWGSWLQDRAPP